MENSVNKRSTVGVDRHGQPLLMIAIISLLCSWIYAECTGTTKIISTNLYTLHSIDLPIVLFVLYCVFNLNTIWLSRSIISVLLALGAVLVWVNFLRGMLAVPSVALLQARFFLPLASVPIAGCLAKNPSAVLFRYSKYAIAAGFLLACLVFLRDLTTPNLFMTIDINAEDVNDGGRGISAQGAMGIATAFWLTFCLPSGSRATRSARLYLLRAFLLSALAASLQLTAIIAAMVSLLIYMTIGNKRNRVVGFMFFVVISLVVIIANQYISDMFADNRFMQHRLDNITTRHAVWESFWYMFSSQPIKTQLFGWPFGMTPDLMIVLNGKSVPWTNSLHSMYFGALKIYGYFSIGLFFAPLLGILVAGILRSIIRGVGAPLIAHILILSCFIFFYSYEANYAVALSIFWAIIIFRSVDVGTPAMPSGKDDQIARPAGALTGQIAVSSPR